MMLAIMAIGTNMATAATNPSAENYRLATFQKQQLKQVLAAISKLIYKHIEPY